MALKSYDIGEYHRAEGLLKQVYAREKGKYAKGEYSFFMGESQRRINMPKKAVSSYQKAVRAKYEDPKALLYMAESLRKTAEYDKALEFYNQYLEIKATDQQAKNGVLSCLMAMENPISQPWIVEKVKAFNSKYSDFSPAFSGTNYDQIYFTSMRSEKKKRKLNRITGQGNSSIYFIQKDGKGEWEKPERMEEPIASDFDDGTPNLSFDGKTFYFTRCPYVNTQPNTAHVFEVQRSGGRWGEPVEVIPGGDSLMVAHPAISPDGTTLYFVSDRPGGYGGLDIYKSIKSDGQWGKAVNLGSEINTAGDEMFPYVRTDGTLYFSSNAHVGFGGLDIFKAVEDENGKLSVVNLGRPINSESDDFGIVFQGRKEEGFFSSSRGSAKGIDAIYSFSMPETNFDLYGKVGFPAKKEKSKVTLRIIGTDGTNQKLVVDDAGAFGVRLAKNTDYVLVATAPGFFNNKRNFTTRLLTSSQTIEVNMNMVSSDELLTLDLIMFQKGELQPLNSSVAVLDQAANYLKSNARYKLDIRCHTSHSGRSDNDVMLSEKRGLEVVKLMISRGVDESRLSIDAIGSEEPGVVDEELAKRFSTIRVGDVINQSLLRKIRTADRKEVEQLNDRIELVLITQ